MRTRLTSTSGFKRRFFVLDHHDLRYYTHSDAAEAHFRGRIDLGTVTEARISTGGDAVDHGVELVGAWRRRCRFSYRFPSLLLSWLCTCGVRAVCCHASLSLGCCAVLCYAMLCHGVVRCGEAYTRHLCMTWSAYDAGDRRTRVHTRACYKRARRRVAAPHPQRSTCGSCFRSLLWCCGCDVVPPVVDVRFNTPRHEAWYRDP